MNLTLLRSTKLFILASVILQGNVHAKKTDSPSESPTGLASHYPSSVPFESVGPTASLTPSEIRWVVFETVLPVVTIEMTLSDVDASSTAAADIDSFFSVFLLRMLSRAQAETLTSITPTCSEM
jgi:hypothetical protein